MNLNQKIIKNKVGLLNLAEEPGAVSKACNIMGFSRGRFYRLRSEEILSRNFLNIPSGFYISFDQFSPLNII